MKLCILGATGRTGEELVLQALEKDYSVVAYVRHPNKLTKRRQITMVTGELNDITKMASAMKGCDAVLVALGNPVSNSSGNLFSLAMPNIIEAMDKAGIRRLISLSALGVGATYHNTRYPYRMGARGFLKGNFADHEAGEKQLSASVLDWTTVHPGPLFNGKRSAKPLVRDAALGDKMPGVPRTNRADVAQVMLQIINDSKTYRKQLIMCSKQDQPTSLVKTRNL